MRRQNEPSSRRRRTRELSHPPRPPRLRRWRLPLALSWLLVVAVLGVWRPWGDGTREGQKVEDHRIHKQLIISAAVGREGNADGQDGFGRLVMWLGDRHDRLGRLANQATNVSVPGDLQNETEVSRTAVNRRPSPVNPRLTPQRANAPTSQPAQGRKINRFSVFRVSEPSP